MMQAFIVGETYPDSRFISSPEGAIVSFTDAFFDIIGLFHDATSKEILEWKTGNFAFGLFVKKAIPFFLIRFSQSGMELDASVNIFKIKNPETWLEGQGNVITLQLIEKNNYTLQLLRLVSTSLQFSEDVRTILKEQLKKFNSKEEVDDEIIKLQSNFSTKEMIRSSNMINI